MFVELRLSDDAAWEERLANYAVEHPDNDRAVDMLGIGTDNLRKIQEGAKQYYEDSESGAPD